ncbi:MAG: hypothetical protein U0350_36570 [Caldilineaceae bacterium]
MNVWKLVRVPLVTLVLLATLLVTSSAFAAAPVVKKAAPQRIFSYMGDSGGGCMHDHMASFSPDDD